jgi:hypothetical protein
MSSIKRRLRRAKHKGRETLTAHTPEMLDDCIFWIDENGVPVPAERAPEHDLECIFNGGAEVAVAGDPYSACLTCYIVEGATEVWDTGRRALTLHCPEEVGDLLLVPDVSMDIARETIPADPKARLARGDGRTLAVYGPIQRTHACAGCGFHDEASA